MSRSEPPSEMTDILTDARNCIECVFMAAGDFSREGIDPAAERKKARAHEALTLAALGPD
jgi:hypothetical protein